MPGVGLAHNRNCMSTALPCSDTLACSKTKPEWSLHRLQDQSYDFRQHPCKRKAAAVAGGLPYVRLDRCGQAPFSGHRGLLLMPAHRGSNKGLTRLQLKIAMPLNINWT
jgi:hypothetical protein